MPEVTRLCSAVEAVVSALACAPLDVTGVSVLRVPVDSGWPLVALVGVLLGYPVVYFVGEDGRNCLSGRDLQRWTLSCSTARTATAAASTSFSDGAAAVTRVSDHVGTSHCVITSFTVPVSTETADAAVRESIQSWRARAEHNAKTSTRLESVCVECAVVNHPSVAL
jgi:hypothetical protein